MRCMYVMSAGIPSRGGKRLHNVYKVLSRVRAGAVVRLGEGGDGG